MCYNTKIYKDDGGDTLHIGGKVVIDAGADISALAEALSKVGIAKVVDSNKQCYGTNVSDLVGEDIRILHGGVVEGTLKYVKDYSKAFGKAEQSGYFFPFTLSDEYKDKEITCKRTSGKPGKEKKANDLEWVLRLTDGADTVYEFSAGDKPIITLTFKNAVFETPAEE